MKHRDPRWYDTKEGVTYAAGNIQRFNELVVERRKAHRERKEELTDFVVRGLWYLDSYGQTSPMSQPYIFVTTFPEGSSYKKVEQQNIPIDVLIRKNKVFTKEEYTAWLPPDASWGYSMGGSLWLPDDKIPCACCGQHWGMVNSHDVQVIHDSIEVDTDDYVNFTLKYVQDIWMKKTDAYYRPYPEWEIQHNRFIDMTPLEGFNTLVMNEHGHVGRKPYRKGIPTIDPETYLIVEGDKVLLNVTRYYHISCQLEMLNKSVLAKFTQAIEACGVEIHGHIRTKNEYGSDSYRGSWFMFDTSMGMLKVGWRKHVITCEIGAMITTGLGSDYRPVETKFESHATLEHTYTYEDFTKLLSSHTSNKGTKENELHQDVC